MIDVAKLLLCVTMVLTFPLPFFTCRELLIIVFIHPFCGSDAVAGDENDGLSSDLIEPLISPDEEMEQATESESPSPNERSNVCAPTNWLLPEDDRQLRLAGHVALTASLWFICTDLAVAAPSLGDVLDLVGCFSGTIIAFILPAIVSFRLEGYSHLALLILMVGGSVGTVGTFYSVKKLSLDIKG